MSIHALSYTFTCISDTCRSSTYTNTYVFLVHQVHVDRISIHTSYTCGINIQIKTYYHVDHLHLRQIHIYIDTYTNTPVLRAFLSLVGLFLSTN